MPISAKAVPHWSSPASSIVRAAARCWGQVSRIGAALCGRFLATMAGAVRPQPLMGAGVYKNSSG